MSFYAKLLDSIRGINATNQQVRQYVFGSIVSGTYTNYKEDPHPTILCLGCYQNRTGHWLVHGIQLHLAGKQLGWILQTIRNIKTTGIITSPQLFYRNLYLTNQVLARTCYRTYYLEMCDFKIVNPGFTNIPQANCYPVDDPRDGFLSSLNTEPQRIVGMPTEDSIKRIVEAANTIKVWD